MLNLKELKLKRLVKRLGINKAWNNEEEEYLWLEDQWIEKGFKSYIYMRDLSVLKGIAEAVRAGNFHKATELSGRRIEILHMADMAKRMYLKNQN